MNTTSVRYQNPNPQPPAALLALAGMIQGGAGQISRNQASAQKAQDDNLQSMRAILPALAQQNRLNPATAGSPNPFQFGGNNWSIGDAPKDWGSEKNRYEAEKLKAENEDPNMVLRRDAAKAQLTQLGNPLTWRNGQPPTQDQYLQIMQNVNAMMSGQTGATQADPTVTGGPTMNPLTWMNKPTVTPGAVTRTVLDKASNKLVKQTLTAKGWVNPSEVQATPVAAKNKKMSQSMAQTFYDQAQGATHEEKLQNAMQAATAAGYDINQ